MSVTPKKAKNKKKIKRKKNPHGFKVQKELAYSFAKSSTQVWTNTLNFVLMCFLLCFFFVCFFWFCFVCFVQHILYTGLGSGHNIPLQPLLFFGFHCLTKINKAISFWFFNLSLWLKGCDCINVLFCTDINTVLAASVPWSQNSTGLLLTKEDFKTR